MSTVDEDTWIGQVAWRAACADRAQGAFAIEGALRVLRGLLSEADARLIVAGLPRGLRAIWERRPQASVCLTARTRSSDGWPCKSN